MRFVPGYSCYQEFDQDPDWLSVEPPVEGPACPSFSKMVEKALSEKKAD